MKKIDKTVLKETAYIAVFSLIFSAIMQAVYLIIGRWDYTVLLGNLMGFAAAVGNFFFMGLTIQSALGKDEKQVRNAVRLSLTLRMLMLAVFVGLGVLLDCFDTIAVVIPFVFPRIAIAFRPLYDKKHGTQNDGE